MANPRQTTETSAPRNSLRRRFQDFDDPHVYSHICDYALREDTHNVVVRFSDNCAEVAHGLSGGDFRQLLQQSDVTLADGTRPVQWINVWNPSRQREVVEAIGEHYHFSNRLGMSIWAWDLYKNELNRRKMAAHESACGRPSGGNVLATATPGLDLEGGKTAAHSICQSTISGTPAASDCGDLFAPENLVTFKMMQDNLSYTTIDQESNFICIGANWLHKRPEYETTKETKETKEAKKASLVPPKHWSWFILCDDHTVISFHEAAYYDRVPTGHDPAAWRAEELQNMRSNTLKVLRQLSTCGLEEDRHNFTQLTSIRQPGQHNASSTQRLDGSSNLFFYLFEDYSAAFHILDTSKTALNEISGRILRTADWKSREDMSDVIPTLYRLNKELRQLHHVFTNYKNVISRLLWSEASDLAPGGIGQVPVSPTASARLSPKAATRFKRLQVQLQSLMLDVIADYLDEKQSLQETYFNLMTQKDSHSTERLTRSATLLAKLSVFFLPISFMTSYFSVEIPHISDSYTSSTYWIAFAVIASISFACLFFFGKVLMFVSESLDHAADRVTRWTSERVGWAQRKKMRDMEDDSL